MKNATLSGKPYAGKSHVRFDVGGKSHRETDAWVFILQYG